MFLHLVSSLPSRNQLIGHGKLKLTRFMLKVEAHFLSDIPSDSHLLLSFHLISTSAESHCQAPSVLRSSHKEQRLWCLLSFIAEAVLVSIYDQSVKTGCRVSVVASPLYHNIEQCSASQLITCLCGQCNS